MTSAPENITVCCPKCQLIYEDWWRPSINPTLDQFDDDYLRKATSVTCPRCQTRVELTSLQILGTERADTSIGWTTHMDQYHVGIAAEAFAAAVFAQTNCDVLVQYGANQPDYDLMISRNGVNRRVSVKGSKDGGWGLLMSFKKGRSYHEAADAWLARQDPQILFCFVQFKGVRVGEMPRIYLATATEAAEYMKNSRGGHGYTSLRERYVWASGIGQGQVDQIPAHWQLSETRLSDFLPS